MIRFGKKAEERLIPVKLGARLTEIGTLETWCESKISENRWRLAVRTAQAGGATRVERKAAAVVSEQALQTSLELIAGGVLAHREIARDAGRSARANWSRPWGWARTRGRSRPYARWLTPS